MRLSYLTALLLMGAPFGGCGRSPADPETAPVREVVVADSVAGRGTLASVPGRHALFVAYTTDGKAGTDVYLARLDGSGAAASPVRVNDIPGDAASHPQAPAQVAAGPEGRVYVAWITQREVEGRRFPASDIRFARSDDGGRTFAPAVTVNPDAGVPTGHHFHNLAVGPDGTVYVSWLDGAAEDLAAMHDGMTAASHHDHHAAHASDGSPGTELHVARSTDGGKTFEAPVAVARGTCQCCRTALAVGDSGEVYVAWRHIFDDLGRDVAVARSIDGGRTFGPIVRVHRDGWQIDGCPHAGPAIALDDTDRLHVTWYTGATGQEGVYYARSADGGATFAAPERLSGPGPIAQVSAFADGDRVWLAWEHPLAHDVSLLRVDDAIDTLSAARMPGLLPSLTVTNGQRVLASSRASELVVAAATIPE